MCSDKKARVLDSILNNNLSIGDVVIGEEMMPLRIGMEWLVIAILFSIGMRCTPVSTLLMQSKIILRLSFSGRAKFSPSCRKHCMSIGMDTEDRLRNHPFRTVVRDEDLCEVKELGCMDIKLLGDNVSEGLLTFDVSLCTDVGPARMPVSHSYKIGLILVMVCASFLSHSHKSL